jgi:tRNA G18 (ribose-2'-O)-methylase SpoU
MNHFPIRIILCDVRSAHNVGAIMRTADACDIQLIYACGYTPFPIQAQDNRPPHVANRNHRAIAKTALGAERLPVKHFLEPSQALHKARMQGFDIIVIEQSENSLKLYDYVPTRPIALVFGNEVLGVPQGIIQQADQVLELPMIGRKESLNVAVTAGIALYQLRFGAQPVQ